MVLIEADSAGLRQASGEDALSEWAAKCFGLAIEAAREGKPLAALAHIDEILARCPDHAPSVRLGISLAGENGEQESLLRYRAIMLVLNPRDASNRRELARLLARQSALAASGDLLKRLAPDSPQAPQPPAEKASDMTASAPGETASRSRSPDGQALADATDPALILRHAQLLYAHKRWDEAHALFGRVESDHPNAGRRRAATIFRARISRNSGNSERALAQFSAILAVEPDNVEACDFLVRQHWIAGRNEEALETVRRFAAVVPDAPEATWLRAEAQKRLGQVELALSTLQAGMAQHARNVTYCCRYADLLVETGALAEALRVLDAAAADEPAASPLFNRRISVARRLGTGHAELLAMCDAFLRHEPSHSEALMQRANSLLRLGRRVEAYDEFVGSARLHPAMPGFWRSAATLAVNLNRRSEAEALAAEARGHFDQRVVSDLCSLAAIYQAADDMTSALEFATAACAADPASAEARAMAGRLLVSDGRYAEAWPHLLEGAAAANRSPDLTAMLAQVAAAFHHARPSSPGAVGIEPVAGLFPEVLFDRLATRRTGALVEDREPVVLHVTSSLAAGGAERQVAATVAAARAGDCGYGVELSVDDLDPATRRDVFLPLVEAAGVPVHVLQEARRTARWRELLVEHAGYSRELRFIAALPHDLRRIALALFVLFVERRPRVVHLWQDMIAVAGCVAGCLAGVPRIVLSTRSTRPVERQRYRRYFEHAFKTFLQCPGVVMINNSRNGARDYEAWLGLAEGSVEVVYNGYDFALMRSRLEATSRDDIRRQLELPDDALLLGGVMRLSFEKRPELWTRVAIELALRDRRVHGVLIGQGPMRAELEAEIARHGLGQRIRLVGQQSPIEPWMAAMDLLFLSSLTEGLPNVLIEAQSLGVPVSTMRIGGAPETVVEGRSAVIADEGDVADIAATLAPLLSDHDRRMAFGAEGKAWVKETFAMQATLAKLDEIYGGGGTAA